jgi:predicted ATPase/GAF domain-containing protein
MNANFSAPHSAGQANGLLQLGTGCENRPLEVLWEDGDRVFCKMGRDGAADHRYAFMPVRSGEHPTADGINRLTHEYGLKDYLDSAWALRPLELLRERGQTMLVVENPGGERLDRIIDQPMEIGQFLRLAVALSSALSRLHGRGLVHKDIKPANVLANVATGQVWLTGFGIASRLPRERQSPNLPEFIAGTLAYMSPEQTGRMNRSIDSRSDLYSLGITLYEMLTASLPFTASDPMEWVHCHTARQPEIPSERVRNVPGAVSAITMKLLSKTVVERYQTAAGVERDLRRCLCDWETQGRVEDFPPGAHDTPDRLMIPEKLYGRDREVDTLLTAFDRIVAGKRPELVLVSGYAGIGKSAVVNELHKPLVPPRGLFASGKFDQYKRDIPYATLAQAFQSLIRPLLSKNEDDLQQWRDALREALDPNGLLIVKLVPELKHIIGEQPPVPELPPQEAQRRFQLVFRRFIGVFARPEHPLALFLDDLQWLDVATLDLLEDLLTRTDLRHLLLIGAYRNNEVSATHPLLRKLDAMRQGGAALQDILLTPLAREDLGQLLADSLHCEPERVASLAELIYQKTTGNPFFAIQFISALADEGLLTFDYGEGCWVWDLRRIRAKGFTDNVVELMVGKLNRLPTETQKALRQFACMGNRAEFEMLRMVHQGPIEDMHDHLWESVRLGLIFRADDSYRFLHDRVQEAAYSLIPTELRPEAHLRIGRVLLASMTEDQLAEHLFDVANQLNRGTAPLVDHDEKVKVAVIDLRAGRKAKASAAYAAADAYFAAGMALLDESDWSSQYELIFRLWLERTECEFLTGHLDTAEQLIVELLQRAASKVDQAAVYCLKIRLKTMKSENQQAVDTALTCLRGFGIDMPAHPTEAEVRGEYETFWQTLNGRSIESLVDLPLMTDPELQAATQVLSVLSAPAYFTDPRLQCLQTCRMVRISVQHGISRDSGYAYANYGFVLSGRFHRYLDGYRFSKLACDLVEKHGFIAGKAKVYVATGATAAWTQPIAEAIDFVQKGFRAGIEAGDLTYACLSAFITIMYLLRRNDPLDVVWRESETALNFVRNARFGDAADIIVSQQRFIASMQGRTATFSTFSDAQFDESAFEVQITAGRMPMVIGLYWILKLTARFLSCDYAAALSAGEKAKELLGALVGRFVLLDYFYYAALTVSALYETATVDDQKVWRELLEAHREQLREWAEINPSTFADKLALVSAEIARLERRDTDAMRLYEQAIRSAREHGFVQNEGLAHEVAARFYATRGFETFAAAYLREARYCYLRWGADGKVQQLDRLYRHLAAPVGQCPTSLNATIGAPVGQLDAETVARASQALSSEIVLPKLIERLMRIALEHAGAGRGLLILMYGDGPYVEAEAKSGLGRVDIVIRHEHVKSTDLPQSALHYVLRTHEQVLLDDASSSQSQSEDEYFRSRCPRSVLCLPILKQAKVIGALYLENNLTAHAFTSGRVAVLEVLASQAAISLENARLYSDLSRSEALLSEAQHLSSTGSFLWRVSNDRITFSKQTYRIFDID